MQSIMEILTDKMTGLMANESSDDDTAESAEEIVAEEIADDEDNE